MNEYRVVLIEEQRLEFFVEAETALDAEIAAEEMWAVGLGNPVGQIELSSADGEVTLLGGDQ